ncbi:hypothetical protein ACFFX1_47380 [Dactylosporangium sucinum]|uniref:Carboxypeptidase regulatory-like domain-containing protein n=1 Tax=Dactylosporangium sucinum TaxID=1424081 RepID=A0A917UAQ9_9ACTN|nr:carboxypeptidase regulatory-like domain-containing protein [Dactylosporangium sucinum]GGM73433.1 hypothetical protein GCM10007977_088780 [Dactylosporangium sucinum]
MTPAEQLLMDRLRGMWQRLDPVPGDLAERVLFRLALEDLDVEIMAPQRMPVGSGARGPERASTISFTSSELTVMVTVSADGRHRRLDGWLTPAAALRVQLHTRDVVHEANADKDGRFAFGRIPEGLVHLVVEPAAARLDRPVITPAFTL